MKPREMDSLDTVELVMMIEEAFDTEITDNDAESFCSPREIVDKLERSFSNARPNAAAKALLKRIAKDQGRPELAEGLEGTWRREQIAAIVREFFRDVD
jgi:hypothetical protein